MTAYESNQLTTSTPRTPASPRHFIHFPPLHSTSSSLLIRHRDGNKSSANGWRRIEKWKFPFFFHNSEYFVIRLAWLDFFVARRNATLHFVSLSHLITSDTCEEAKKKSREEPATINHLLIFFKRRAVMLSDGAPRAAMSSPLSGTFFSAQDFYCSGVTETLQESKSRHQLISAHRRRASKFRVSRLVMIWQINHAPPISSYERISSWSNNFWAQNAICVRGRSSSEINYNRIKWGGMHRFIIAGFNVITSSQGVRDSRLRVAADS